MKNILRSICILMIFAISSSCEKYIDLKPESNVSVDNYYRSYNDINTGLIGCLGGMREPLNTEWMVTEMRTDNAKQASTGSSSAPNLELNDLNMYVVSPEHPQVFNYWYSVYQNIRNVNLVLKALGVKYNPQTGENMFEEISFSLDEAKRKQLAGEALFIRAYHYFNLVRLYGGVFLLTEPFNPEVAKAINRSSVDDTYKLIVADLKMSSSLLVSKKYDATSSTLGRPTIWAVKALLAKVYLSTGNKPEALALLTGIILNSGHTLLVNYSDVFSVTNEMNAEIIFSIRFKAGGVGLGSQFANLFAPTNSGAAIINGDGSGYNYPTTDLSTAMPITDKRRVTTMGLFSSKLWVTKFFSSVMIKNDAENDFPVLRYSDVLLMMAEAQGFPAGLVYLNQTRIRAGLTALDATTVPDQNAFITELLKERRMEFAFENQRFFDLVRLNSLLPVMKAYYASEYVSHYSKYKPIITLAALQARITENKKLLPIPQREIDTNNDLIINQNP